MFDTFVYLLLGNNERTLFWSDAWLARRFIKSLAPVLWVSIGRMLSALERWLKPYMADSGYAT